MNISEATLFRIFDVLGAIVFAVIYFGIANWLFPLIFLEAPRAILDTVAGLGAIVMGRVMMRMFSPANPKD